MRVGFDAKRFFLNYTGLGNYSRFVVNALSGSFPENKYLLFSPRAASHPDTDPILARRNVEQVLPAGIFRYMKSLWRTAGIGFESAASKIDIYHGLAQELPVGLPSHVRKVVTVHDLIFLRYPEFYNPVDVRIYKAKVAYACSKADVVIAISEQTASDLETFLKIDRSRIKVVYQGCHPQFKTVVSEAGRRDVRERYDLPADYILSVGTIEARKNQALIVKALSMIKTRGVSLVLVGKATPYLEEVKKAAVAHGVESRIRYIHQAKFGDLPAIYQTASVFVYPSLFEGFGIPIVEAIASRVPVIAARASCLPEAGGPATVYVDPVRAEELAEQLDRLLNDQVTREEIIASSLNYAARFESNIIAHELNEIYQRVIGR
jgi:glycosyltransferase involved in cell wall biosynthesis